MKKEKANLKTAGKEQAEKEMAIQIQKAKADTAIRKEKEQAEKEMAIQIQKAKADTAIRKEKEQAEKEMAIQIQKAKADTAIRKEKEQAEKEMAIQKEKVKADKAIRRANDMADAQIEILIPESEELQIREHHDEMEGWLYKCIPEDEYTRTVHLSKNVVVLPKSSIKAFFDNELQGFKKSGSALVDSIANVSNGAILTSQTQKQDLQLSIPYGAGGTRDMAMFSLWYMDVGLDQVAIAYAFFSDVSTLAKTRAWLPENHDKAKITSWLKVKLANGLKEAKAMLQKSMPTLTSFMS